MDEKTSGTKWSTQQKKIFAEYRKGSGRSVTVLLAWLYYHQHMDRLCATLNMARARQSDRLAGRS